MSDLFRAGQRLRAAQLNRLVAQATAGASPSISTIPGLQTALDGKAAIRSVPTTVSTATFTPALTDENGFIRLTNAGGCIVTLPNDATVAFPVGAEITFQQANATSMSFQPSGGAPALEFPNVTHQASTNVQHSIVQAKKTAANTWTIYGNLRLA